MSRFLLAFALCTLAVTGTANKADAGSRQGNDSSLPIEDVSAFAGQVQQTLAEHGAQLAIISRVGRDPSELPKGIAYTHVGIWIYSDMTLNDGRKVRGYRVHNLYQRADNPDVSDLIQDGPIDFFAGAQRLDAGIIIPDRRLQAKLLNVIASPAYASLHNASYSAVANPANNDFQNCTEYTLNLLMAALYDTNDMSRIKANIGAHFQPQEIEVSPLKRLLGPIVMDGISMSDQEDAIRTTTFTTLADFMKLFELTESVQRQTETSITPL